MAKKTDKKSTASKKAVVVKKQTVVKPAKTETEKPVVSFEAILPPAPEKEVVPAKIETVDFDTFVEAKDPATAKKVHTPKKATKSLEFLPELKDKDLEILKAKCLAFTGKVYGRTWINKNTLESFAKEEFGDAIKASSGLNPREIIFDIHGVRIPEEGVFFIR